MKEQLFDLSSHCADGLTAAYTALRAGECVVIPTDTVYGIAADAFNPEAVARLLAAKGRGRDMPVPVLVADIEDLSVLTDEVPEAAFALAKRYWPGALSLIFKVRPSLLVDLGDTMDTIMVRVPDDDRTRALLRRTGPLGVSSANSTGHSPATTCEQALQMLGDSVSVYLDGGATMGTVPSTIVDFAADKRGVIRRHGVLTTADIAELAPEVIAPG